MKSISILLLCLVLIVSHMSIATGAQRRLSENEVKALLATSPVFEERAEQTVQYTLNSDGSASAFARWLLWTFSMTGSWQMDGKVVCIFMKPKDEEGSQMCGTFTHLEKNHYRFDEDDGEQTDVFLVSTVSDETN